MKSFSWICPYCHHDTTVVDRNYSNDFHFYSNPEMKDNYIGLKTEIIACPNSECGEYSIRASLYNAHIANGFQQIFGEPLAKWNLKPSSQAIPQPDYIPVSIRTDYEEACSILMLSPKASATLARRCLQGMIRDFWGIKKSRLFDEVQELKDMVVEATWEAIDAIRQIGNIGAHMEKDVNIIVDIEPIEAQLLIQLIEDLFLTWYVARHEREERLKQIQALAQSKKNL